MFSSPTQSAARQPLKVLHVAETIRGGIASYLNELHPRQQASFGADNVHYVVPSDHRHDLPAVDESQITTFERSGRSISGLFQMLRASMQALDALKPDVVHLHSSFAGLVLRPALAARSEGPRVVYCPARLGVRTRDRPPEPSGDESGRETSGSHIGPHHLHFRRRVQ
ncbi:glycosyltransferase [Bradyrhizobium sp. LM6.9]